jgi:hypothetical protein
LMFEAVERGVEGALLDFETILGDLLDAQQNSIAVEGAQGDGFEDEHVEGALQQVEWFCQNCTLLEDLGRA